MTIFSKSQLKTFFEQGDVPTGTDYANFIDSCVNLGETTNQSMAGPLTTTKLVTPTVSATNFILTGTFFAATVSANSAYISDLNVGTSYTQNGGSFSLVGGSNVNISPGTGNVNILPDFGSVNIGPTTGGVNIGGSTQTQIQSGLLIDGPYTINDTVIVSAAGITQGTATSVGTTIGVRLQGATDGSATGYILTRTNGNFQLLYNENAVSANLWPPVGCKINGLSSNAAFALAATTGYTVFEYSTSAYWVK